LYDARNRLPAGATYKAALVMRAKAVRGKPDRQRIDNAALARALGRNAHALCQRQRFGRTTA
jgi:hypothetical protein